MQVEPDGLEEGAAQELVEAGIPKEEIILGFFRPERRKLTEFAVDENLEYLRPEWGRPT